MSHILEQHNYGLYIHPPILTLKIHWSSKDTGRNHSAIQLTHFFNACVALSTFIRLSISCYAPPPAVGFTFLGNCHLFFVININTIFSLFSPKLNTISLTFNFVNLVFDLSNSFTRHKINQHSSL